MPPEEEEPELAEICDDATPIGGTRAVEVPKFTNQQKKPRQPAIPKVGMFYIGGKEAATAATEEEEEDDGSRESSPVLMSTSSSSADSGHGCSLKSSSAHTSASVSPIPPSYAARNRRGSLSASGGSAASSPTLALKSHQVKQQQQRRHNRPCSGVFSSRAQHNDNEVVGPFGGKPPLPMSSSFHGAMAGSTTQLEKMKSFNRTLRRARSFRGGRERSCSNASEYRRPNNNNNCNNNNNEKNSTKSGSKRSMTYCVQRTKYGRKGWKVMLPPEAEEDNDKAFFDKAALEKVMGRIRDLEFSGKEVPERITVEVN